jgi:hypothetical protein
MNSTKSLPVLKTSFIARTCKAVKSGSLSQICKLVNDVLKHHFARYLIVDAYGTVKMCWTLSGAIAWIPFCAPELARIVDTLDFTTIYERRQAYAY